MATDAVSNEPPYLLPLELCPVVDHIVTEIDAPLINVFCEKQQRLLTEPLYSSWAGPGGQRSFVAMSKVGLFFAVRRAPLVPNVLLSLDVERPADLHSKNHRSYFIWEYGKVPDIVIEVVANREGGESSEKLAAYARIMVGYYVIFDPDRLLSSEMLRVYCRDVPGFRKMDGPASFPDVGLGLQIWQGRYEDHEGAWLRWIDSEGTLIPTGQSAPSRRRRAPTGWPNNYGNLASNRASGRVGFSAGRRPRDVSRSCRGVAGSGPRANRGWPRPARPSIPPGRPSDNGRPCRRDCNRRPPSAERPRRGSRP